MKRIGIDIGSTTIKCVVMDDQGNLLHKSYERHFAMIKEKTQEVIKGLIEKFNITEPVVCAVSGSAGMGLAERAGVPFVQEVYATKVAISHRLPDTDVVIELGGEDAKILFLKGKRHYKNYLALLLAVALLLPVGGEGEEVVALEVHHGRNHVHDSFLHPQDGILENGIVGIMTGYEEKFHALGTPINRCEVVCKPFVLPPEEKKKETEEA